jgi:hypothetical protein
MDAEKSLMTHFSTEFFAGFIALISRIGQLIQFALEASGFHTGVCGVSLGFMEPVIQTKPKKPSVSDLQCYHLKCRYMLKNSCHEDSEKRDKHNNTPRMYSCSQYVQRWF